jgi:hypothetical protein
MMLIAALVGVSAHAAAWIYDLAVGAGTLLAIVLTGMGYGALILAAILAFVKRYARAAAIAK